MKGSSRKPANIWRSAACWVSPGGVVALTKRDLVDDDLLELAQLEVEELLADTAFAGAPVMPVSSTTGEGLEELRSAVLERARGAVREEDPQLPLRLPVDRAFHLRGLGVVATGTLISGGLEAGQAVAFMAPPETRAEAGERTAVQLAGIDLQQVERGVQLSTPGALESSRTLCARFTLLEDAPEAITSFVPVRLHLYSSEVIGKLRPLGGQALEPGGEALVEIRLAELITAVRGDRFVVRRPSPAATLGGGEILDPRWRRRRGAGLQVALGVLEDLSKVVRLWVAEGAERGAAATAVSRRLGWPVDRATDLLDQQVKAGHLLKLDTGRGRRWLEPGVFQRISDHAGQVLKDYFAADRLARSMPKAELLSRLLPKRAHEVADVYLRWLEAQQVLEVRGGQVNLPGREAKLSGEESRLAESLLAKVEAAGLTPPLPDQLDTELGAKRQIVAGVVKYLLDGGQLVRLPSGLMLAKTAIDGLRRDLDASGLEEITVAQFKERFGLSRKWAIPLLEHLDSIGATRRMGDKRQLIRG
nr:selenocysteine-specific elongation factor-like [Nerophis lumbriciformis]